MTRPFRWDLSRPEQLGGLIERVDSPTASDRFIADVRRCCARILSAAGAADLVFVGRSPESLYDYLSGALERTDGAGRLTLLNVSLFGFPPDAVRRLHPELRDAVRSHLTAVGLTPEKIAARARPVALVDVVASGNTFGALAALLLDWAGDSGIDERAVTRRLRFVGLTPGRKPSPCAWRWQQHASWPRRFRPAAIRNVALDQVFWDYLAGLQSKVSHWNPPDRWGAAELARPSREPSNLEALKLAASVRSRASEAGERRGFAAELARQPGMREGWMRSLILELRGACGRPRSARTRCRTGSVPWRRGAARPGGRR